MTRNPQQEERLVMMSRLGELSRILRNVFVAEMKPALIMEVACNRMISSYRSAMNTGESSEEMPDMKSYIFFAFKKSLGFHCISSDID